MYASISEAQRQLDKLVDMVLDGEEVIICRLGVPVAQLVAIIAKLKRKPSRRASST